MNEEQTCPNCQELSEWKSQVEEKLKNIIKIWETKMGDEDKTLYTLGVRRSLDIVLGRDPNA